MGGVQRRRCVGRCGGWRSRLLWGGIRMVSRPLAESSLCVWGGEMLLGRGGVGIG